MEISQKDLIIIGGSAAAVSAAIYAVRSNLDVCIITRDIGGQIVITNEIGNYPGFSTIGGMELMIQSPGSRSATDLVHRSVGSDEIGRVDAVTRFLREDTVV